MSTRRDHRWWKERWVADHYAQLKSPAALLGFMDHKGHTCASLARVATHERQRNGSDRGCSRQMISYLTTGKVKSCEPDLAAAIERVLDLPDHALFAVLPKSREKRDNVKGQAA